MRNEITKLKTFERRAVVLGGVKLLVSTALVSRLYYLQVMKADEFRTKSESNRIKLIPLMPTRGRILDRNGVVIADSTNHFRAVYEAYDQENYVDILKRAGEMIGFDSAKIDAMVEKFNENRKQDLIIEEYLNWEQVSKLEVNKPDLPGVFIETGQVRNYPYYDSSSHLIGYIGPVSKEESEKNVIMRHPDFRVGKNGIEKICEPILQGKTGIRRAEVNAFGNIERELSTDESVKGRDITLTVDINLQNFASNRLANLGGVKKEGGSAVVIDVENGEVVCLVSRPAFDTNNFIRGISRDLWKTLNEDPDVPLVNKSISNQYPPGSTFKCLVALAALENKVIDKSTSIYCGGHFSLGSRVFRCWKKEGHGSLSVREALAHSCNVFFYTTAQRMGVEKIAEMGFKMGLGKITGIEIPNEKGGIIPNREWKMKTYKKDWMAGETINTGVGQGYVLTTPLQLALMTARLASKGKNLTPRLFKGTAEQLEEIKHLNLQNSTIVEKIMKSAEQQEIEKIPGISEANIDLVMQGMEMVVNTPGGTAYQSRIAIPGFEMAGKTGTAQVKSHTDGSTEEPKERKYKNHALFIGYAPISNPKFAIAVVVEHGSKGSATAAPAARDILMEAQRLYSMKSGGSPGFTPEEIQEVETQD